MHFHNTIQAPVQLTMQFNAECQNQEDRIYEIFCEQKKPLAWFEVKGFVPDFNDCSIKRSLTNLTNTLFNKEDGTIKRKARLEKITDKSKMVTGTFGKLCHRYKLI